MPYQFYAIEPTGKSARRIAPGHAAVTEMTTVCAQSAQEAMELYRDYMDGAGHTLLGTVLSDGSMVRDIIVPKADKN